MAGKKITKQAPAKKTSAIADKFTKTAIFDVGNYIISYLPQPGAPIAELTQGEHKGSVRYWLIKDGENASRTYSWTFFID